MRYFHPFLFSLFRFLLPACLVATSYLYFYPVFNGCDFPSPAIVGGKRGPDTCIFESKPKNPFEDQDGVSRAPPPPSPRPPEVAPFRLLALADPQLEGDTSLPRAPNGTIRALQYVQYNLSNGNVHHAIGGLIRALREIIPDLLRYLQYVRKSLDLFGNDYYLAHIYRSLRWWTAPTHVTVLGDLLGSQWISDEEFERRSWRYWHRVFSGGQQAGPELLHGEEYKANGPRKETISDMWRNRIINVAGNHDIGYAGDITQNRIDRFEHQFGPVNGDIVFALPNTTASTTPTVRILVLNSMNLDTPALDEDLQMSTYGFINEAISHSSAVGTHDELTILLTHIPLHKDPGVCADHPLFNFFSDDEGGGVNEQNMLSADLSREAILQGLLGKHPSAESPGRGMGRDAVILTGHDHEGCDVYHYAERPLLKERGNWRSVKWISVEAQRRLREEDTPGVREITVRSMMGEFGGNALLLSAWWDEPTQQWRYEAGGCFLGVQHLWWGIHILDIVTLLLGISAVVVYFMETREVQLEKKLPSRGTGSQGTKTSSNANGHPRKEKDKSNGHLGQSRDIKAPDTQS